MTTEEAKEVLDDMKVKIDIPKSAVTQRKRNEALDMAISALSENNGKWIPVSSIEEVPKDWVWVTHKGTDYAYVEELGWDSQRECRTEDGGFRCDSNRLKDVVTYMPCSEPEPYKAEKPETCKGCLEPCIMYEPDMRACKKKVTERGE